MVSASNLVQRGLQSLNEQLRSLRPQEGEKDTRETRESKDGQSTGRAAGKAKSGKAGRTRGAKGKRGLGGALGLGSALYVDAFEDDEDLRDRKRRARYLLGDDETPVFIAKSGEHRDLSATVAPEFRAQVAAGLARANTFTVGSTLIDANAGASVDEGGW